jgi:type IV pilus assembly protein PilY1
MYVGDMGGQLWRFDIIRGNNRSSLVEGGVLASLGAAESALSSAPEADIRRFYNTPDVVNVIKNENVFLSINIGSGYRAHPLDTSINDEFFAVRDFHSTQVIPTNQYGSQAFPLITRDNLIDITNNADSILEPSDRGWRLGMVQNEGEKILGESLTIDNVLLFNSFAPINSAQTCLPGGGINRNYRVSIIDGNPLTNLDSSVDADNLTPRDRFVEGQIGAPISGPILLPNDEGCSGVGCFDGKRDFPGNDTTPTRVNKTYWYSSESP